MAGDERRRIERSGAFLSDGFQNIAVPIRTLSDEYHDRPEPVDSDVVPPREPDGLLTRIAHALRSRGPQDEE